MEVVDLSLSGLRQIRPRVFGDDRGFFMESYNAERYASAGIDTEFVQDNHSRSVKDTVRGLHYQSTPGQAKLVRVIAGRILDVAADIRPNSPTFGKWEGVILDAEQHLQLFIPLGFAHGFCVLSEVAEVLYKVSSSYDPETERSIRWDDPEIGVQWPVKEPLLSSRDIEAESFAEFRRRVQS